MSLRIERLLLLQVTIAVMRYLTSLNLQSWGLTQLPAWMGQLSSLCCLWLDDVSLRNLPASFSHMSNLWTLQITRAPTLLFLCGSFGQLRSLRRLHLENTAITSLPEDMGDLTDLQDLTIARCPLSTLPDSLCRLVSLRVLRLQQLELMGLPRVRFLTVLRRLVLHSCSVQEGADQVLDLGIDDLPQLRCLTVAACSGIRVPRHVTRRPHVVMDVPANIVLDI